MTRSQVRLPDPGGVRSFWLEEALAADAGEPCPPLGARIAADVCIVGGGFAGLWTANELMEREPGLRVALLEADICGGGASGRNGGFVSSSWHDIEALADIYGEREGVRYAVALASEIDAWARGAAQRRGRVVPQGRRARGARGRMAAGAISRGGGAAPSPRHRAPRARRRGGPRRRGFPAFRRGHHGRGHRDRAAGTARAGAAASGAGARRPDLRGDARDPHRRGTPGGRSLRARRGPRGSGRAHDRSVGRRAGPAFDARSATSRTTWS